MAWAPRRVPTWRPQSRAPRRAPQLDPGPARVPLAGDTVRVPARSRGGAAVGRRWAASNTAARGACSPPGAPGPPDPGLARRRPGAHPGAAGTPEHNGPEHKAGALPAPPPAAPAPTRAPAFSFFLSCNRMHGLFSLFFAFTCSRLAGLGSPGSAPLHILAVAWDPSGAPSASGSRRARAGRAAGRAGGRRRTLTAARAPPAGDVIPSAAAAEGRGLGGTGPCAPVRSRVVATPPLANEEERRGHLVRGYLKGGGSTWDAGC